MIFAKAIEKAYRKQTFTRYDETGDVFYFSVADFDGLVCEEYPFAAKAGHTLQGYFYHYGAPALDRIVVFDHGMGGGHRAYMREIEQLARHGYRVFAYDHTGCMRSEGESTGGFAQSLCDLDSCLCALKADDRFANAQFSAVGHSWGGYACLNIAAHHADLAHIVAISGFASVEAMLRQNLKGWLRPYVKHLLRVERKTNPSYADAHALDALQATSARVLIIHSEDDPLVSAKEHFEMLRTGLKGHKNIGFLPVKGKGHSPNYTADAVQYKDEFFAALTEGRKKGALVTHEQKRAFIDAWDFWRMTAQDAMVWRWIFGVLDS